MSLNDCDDVTFCCIWRAAKGKSVNELQERTGTRIQIQRERDMAPNAPMRRVVISGGTENDRMRAQEMIFAKIRDFHDSRGSNAECTISPRSGPMGSQAPPPAMMLDSDRGQSPTAAQISPEELSLSIPIPSETVGYIIGRRVIACVAAKPLDRAALRSSTFDMMRKGIRSYGYAK